MILFGDIYRHGKYQTLLDRELIGSAGQSVCVGHPYYVTGPFRPSGFYKLSSTFYRSNYQMTMSR